jgi:hypothetical protein
MSDDVRNDENVWWYCLLHNTVERGVGCANSERLGPFDSEEEARVALTTAAERTEQWDSDPLWNDEE